MWGFGTFVPIATRLLYRSVTSSLATLLVIANCADVSFLLSTDEAREKRDEIYNGEPHKSHLSHELIGGGAAFEAMKLFEDRQRKEGM
ncbi:hypothetical protein O1611_g2894 [Lasiodiplodia mahajangana]|uniref:Uncharacterized protein n=1 Tax=Lasiodiplodia mahajangana TaxID=1108764 RepID=A0ACC2JTC1_9PEZI|nr:hypothetical protein O1611_g2894 [Lasiodiplodia mahajangana]